jgi:para-nitrobenzyl esterase
MKKKAFVTLLVLFCMIASLILSLTGCGTAEPSTLEKVRLDSGPVSGVQDGAVRSYLGIPYAAPPVGELRFKEPQPVKGWKDVRACTEYGPACPQKDSGEISGGDVGQTSEDCLYLNVWTPAKEPTDTLPVMVWIHGGGFTTGAGSLPIYNGKNLAASGVVVVTVNYRLGPLGFLAHPALSGENAEGSSGNYGLLDQIEALKWVQRNIAGFGGDAGRVTVFGESAGGISVCDLMVSSLTAGLFQRAISQSGPYTALSFPSGSIRDLATAEATGERFATALGCEDAADVAAAMRGKSVDELLQASEEMKSPLTGTLKFGPVIDGWVLEEDPAVLFAAGRQHNVPLLVGTNADEGTIFAPKVTLGEYRALVAFVYGDSATEVLAMYPAGSDQEAQASLQRLITEMGFAAQARFAAACVADSGSSSYLYQFTQVIDNPLAKGLGSFHGLEIPYVFGNLDAFGSYGVSPRESDLALSRAIMGYWASFAANGIPAGEVAWPAYQPSTDQNLELGKTIVVNTGLYKQQCDLAETFLLR